jgi:hypothetical protein
LYKMETGLAIDVLKNGTEEAVLTVFTGTGQ